MEKEKDPLEIIAKYVNQGDYVVILIEKEVNAFDWLNQMGLRHEFNQDMELLDSAYLAMVDYENNFCFALFSGLSLFETVRHILVKHARYGRVLNKANEDDKILIEKIIFPNEHYTWSENDNNSYIFYEHVVEAYQLCRMGMEFSNDYLEVLSRFCVENELYRESSYFKKLIKQE